ncbi:hypothetical protein [Lysinibacillus cavernae]|uniref:hypothetical protein n=1 Tax=Lysinibacillus cavernae TaxID=2666135 RepID=UPI0012D867DD|nr:hypothetical protein [Lysinibacillus cavernae]
MKNIKKIIVFIIALALFFTQVPFYAKASSNEEEYKRSLENIINVIEENLDISSEGFKITEKDNILSNLDQYDIQMLNNLSREQGINVPITKETLIQDLEIQFDNLNEDIEDGKLIVLDNGTMIDSTDKNFYIQGGSTYDESHWWGNRRYMSTAAAREYVYTLRDAAGVTTGLALASVIFGAAGAIPASVNGVTALWCNQLANRVEYHNGNTNRGVRIDLYWVLVFDVEPQ